MSLCGPGDDEVELLAHLEELVVFLVSVVDQPRSAEQSAAKHSGLQVHKVKPA